MPTRRGLARFGACPPRSGRCPRGVPPRPPGLREATRHHSARACNLRDRNGMVDRLVGSPGGTGTAFGSVRGHRLRIRPGERHEIPLLDPARAGRADRRSRGRGAGARPGRSARLRRARPHRPAHRARGPAAREHAQLARGAVDREREAGPGQRARRLRRRPARGRAAAHAPGARRRRSRARDADRASGPSSSAPARSSSARARASPSATRSARAS